MEQYEEMLNSYYNSRTHTHSSDCSDTSKSKIMLDPSTGKFLWMNGKYVELDPSFSEFQKAPIDEAIEAAKLLD